MLVLFYILGEVNLKKLAKGGWNPTFLLTLLIVASYPADQTSIITSETILDSAECVNV